jgi:hypothetical protein
MKTIPLACLLAALLPLAPAAAQQYPNKPIRVIAPSSAGGPVDVIARILAPAWSEVLGQPMVIDNRAGAAGQIGTEMAAKALPDGYTVLLGFSGPLVIVPQINVSTPYDTLKEFAPVALVATNLNVLVVRPESPVKTVPDLIALAKAKPGMLSFGNAGGTSGGGSEMGAKAREVPSRTAGAAHAVQVRLVVFGDGVVDHVRDIVNIDTASCHIGGDEDFFLAGLERRHRLLACLALQRRHGQEGPRRAQEGEVGGEEGIRKQGEAAAAWKPHGKTCLDACGCGS